MNRSNAPPYSYDSSGHAITGQPTQVNPAPQVGFIQGPASGSQVIYGQPQPGYGPTYGQPPALGYGQPPPPREVVLMERPPAIPGVPPGLEYLSQIDQLLIHQQVELFEVMTGVQTCNKYQIKNTLGQQVYFAGEESDDYQRMFWGVLRGFIMHISDNFGAEIMRATRKFKRCTGCCLCCASFDCCTMELAIEAPVGQICGYVRQKCSCITPYFVILDASREPVFNIVGPTCMCRAQDQEFKVYTLDGAQVIGMLSKQWGGYAMEAYTNADNFSVTFPMDLDVRKKALLLGTVFLIDFMFFEGNPVQRHNRPR